MLHCLELEKSRVGFTLIKNGVPGTIEILSYDRNKIQQKVEQAEPSAEERRSERRSGMTGIMVQLTDLAQAKHELTKIMTQYMEKSKEWLISRNWSFANYHMKQTRDDLTRLQNNLKPSYPEEELVYFPDLLWIQNN